MKITEIDVFRVSIPFGETSYKTGSQESISSLDGTILSIKTDEGLVGWGEMTPWGSAYLPEYAAGVRAGVNELAPKLIGEIPTNLAAINEKMDNELCGHRYVKSAFDMACWDILGKASGQPLYSLLGGMQTIHAPLNCAVYTSEVEDMISRIGAYREQGIKIFSTKPSAEADTDIKLFEAIAAQRHEGETYIADANRSWSVPTALRVARNLEQYGFYNLEQPCETYEECLNVRRQTHLTMAIDETLTDFDVLCRVFRDRAADIMHIKLSRVGGLSRARQMRDFCLVAGLSLSWAASGGTEISDAAATHIACSTPPKNLFGLWSCREFNTERFAEGGPIIRDGRSTMSDAPGLGVDIMVEKLGQPIATYR